MGKRSPPLRGNEAQSPLPPNLLDLGDSRPPTAKRRHDVTSHLVATDWMHLQGFIQTPQGGYNPPPSFHATPPNHLKFKGGYQGGVYVIVMEWVINVVKY